MIKVLDEAAIQAEFLKFKPKYADEGGARWRASYSEQVAKVRNADAATWVSASFQQDLWDADGVSSIGPGRSVSVVGAYTDKSLAEFLLKLRDQGLPSDPQSAAEALQAAFDGILDRVRPKHTLKRPRARIVRILAAMFPHHMTCLMDYRRTRQVQALIGAAKASTDWVGQNPLIRARLREAITDPDVSDIDYAMFCWFLWETHFAASEPGVEAVGGGREPVDLPLLSLLPATAQRRGLTFVRDNVRLLVAILREAEQGLSRPDLVDVIQRESPQLSQGSASIIISQAQGGLGLIQFSDGAYRPTPLGAEVLASSSPELLLQAPLVGRVMGVAHLLLILHRKPEGALQKALAVELQSYFPTWTTARAGQELIQWAVATRLVGAHSGSGGTLIRLTEDGEDFATALPADFETRWNPSSDTAGENFDVQVTNTKETDSSSAQNTYGTADIIADGSFLSTAEIEDILALLRHKKNLVLQGPPGTGKTWLARRLAYALAGAKDPSRVTSVQFQQSLSYEDFVRGWRPYAGEDGKGGLRLADGAFLESVNAALERPDEMFVLVIEEINRGNPAQILGELLTLLEADKRVPGEALRLAYPRDPAERVYIPPNLHVIGTMNLADRSLALVDLALRRRFAFVTLKPTLNAAWRAWCIGAGAPGSLIDAIEERLSALNSFISADSRLRSQFCVGHSFVTPPKLGVEDWVRWFQGVVETEISPLLDEYWYDDEATAKSQRAKLTASL